MSSFIIQGGKKLAGEITPQGAKNEALEVVSAVLLTREPVIINNIPDIVDVNSQINLLAGLGVSIEKLGKSSYKFQADKIKTDFLESDEFKATAGSLRGSVLLLGPLLARLGRAVLPIPGGDKIGRRPLDTHLTGFEQLGAKVKYDSAQGLFELSSDDLTGNFILTDEISVTGTANLMMAACLASGVTTIYNAACEPYVQQLSKMLISMGAIIKGVGSNLVTITGVSSLHGCEHTILPDMIEVGSFIGLAAMTSSNLTIKDCRVDMLGQIPRVFNKMGIELEIKDDSIRVVQPNGYTIQTLVNGAILTIADAPWPGLPPDLLSILLVVATQASGALLIHQKMFESRLFFVDKLIDMGARIILCDPHRATVIGLNKKVALRGILMSSPDIRAGVALLIAALAAEGESIIQNVIQIDRGYENIDTRLKRLGADITRVE